MTDIEIFLKTNSITKCPTFPPDPSTVFGISVSKHLTKDGRHRKATSPDGRIMGRK